MHEIIQNELNTEDLAENDSPTWVWKRNIMRTYTIQSEFNLKVAPSVLIDVLIYRRRALNTRGLIIDYSKITYSITCMQNINILGSLFYFIL